MLLNHSKRLEIYLKQPVNISIKGFHNEIHGIRGVIVGDCIPAGSTPIGKDVKTEAVYGLFDSSDSWDKRWKESHERNVVDSCIYCGRSAHCYLAQITAELSVIGHFECEDGHQYSKMVTKSEMYEDYKVYGGTKLVEKRKMKLKGGRK